MPHRSKVRKPSTRTVRRTTTTSIRGPKAVAAAKKKRETARKTPTRQVQKTPAQLAVDIAAGRGDATAKDLLRLLKTTGGKLGAGSNVAPKKKPKTR